MNHFTAYISKNISLEAWENIGKASQQFPIQDYVIRLKFKPYLPSSFISQLLLFKENIDLEYGLFFTLANAFNMF